ncbi:hypothetical protein TorRG33x02_324200, partial [Trema orientale]
DEIRRCQCLGWSSKLTSNTTPATHITELEEAFGGHAYGVGGQYHSIRRRNEGATYEDPYVVQYNAMYRRHSLRVLLG